MIAGFLQRAAVGVTLVFLLAGVAQSQGTPREAVARSYQEVLQKEGYLADLNASGNIAFKVEGRQFTLLIDAKDTSFVYLMSNLGRVDDDQMFKALAAANVATKDTKIAKVFLEKLGAETFVMESFEMKVTSPEHFKALLPGAITYSQVAIRKFYESLSASPAQPKPMGAPADVAPTIVRIAHVGPLTGSLKHLGKDDENGVALAIAQANEKGIRIDGRPIRFEMVSEDDQGNPQLAAAVARKLVDAKVAAVIGHLNSGVTIPASEIYDKAGIPVISGASTNPRLTERGMRTVFRTIGRDDQQGPAIAAYIAQELKAKRVAIVDDQTAYGELTANEVEKALRAARVTIVGRERTTDRQTDFRTILTRIRAWNPDVVFHGGMETTGGPMLKQARELALGAVFAFADGACTDEMGRIAGQAAEGMVCAQSGLPPESINREFVDAFRPRYGSAVMYAPYFYDSTVAVIEAIKRANSVDPARFTRELFEVSFTGATGKVNFDYKGDRQEAVVTMFKMYNGKLAPVSVVRNGAAGAFR
jgi:branched-chain amino acid transport system substrate-binding protein